MSNPTDACRPEPPEVTSMSLAKVDGTLKVVAINEFKVDDVDLRHVTFDPPRGEIRVCIIWRNRMTTYKFTIAGTSFYAGGFGWKDGFTVSN